MRMARPVIVEGDDLAVRLRDAAEAGAVAIPAVRVLVDVVAEMQHEVEILSPRDPTVGVEVPDRQVCAGGYCQPRAVDRAGGYATLADRVGEVDPDLA